MTDRLEVLLSAANVLIDYRDSDPTILRLVSEHVGPVHVLRQVLAETKGMTLAQCRELSITVHELETEALLEQVNISSRLAFADRLCFLACRMHGWTCVSNDQRLRRTCEEDGISVRWGLELMIELVRVSALSPARAKQVAERIHENNPFHITRELIERFAAKLGAL